MKITRNKNSLSAGNALVVAMVLCGVVGLVMVSYMQLVQARTKIRARSLAWNTAIPVLEGGIEEAFTHLQDDTNSITANGWAAISTNSTIVYQKTRTNSDNTYYVVTLSNTTATPMMPTIYSKGFVPAPLGSGYISRLVCITTKRQSVFSKAVAAKSDISFGGNSVIDSFNSSDTNASTGGFYDPAKRRANGGLVTSSTSDPAVKVGNSHVYGPVETGPGGGISVGTGSIGDTNWASGIEPGWTDDTFNFAFPDANPPAGYATWVAPASGSYLLDGTNYSYKLQGNYYAPAGFSMGSGDAMLISGPSSFYVSGGNLTIGGNSYIYLAPGASLKIYVGCQKASFGGGGIANGTGLAANLSIIGMTNCTDVSYAGGASLIGTVYAPEAMFSMTGGSSFYGAAIVYGFAISGGGSLHYDEALGVPGPLVLASYREL